MSFPLRSTLPSLLILAAVALSPSDARAAQPREIPSALVIAKSSNRNQVHYAVAIDDACNPSGAAPVRPYWRMLERGPEATEPLSRVEEQLVGVARQDVEGDSVRVALRAFPTRPVSIHTWRSAEGACTSAATTVISGKPSLISRVYVQQSLLGISYVLIDGVEADGTKVEERITR